MGAVAPDTAAGRDSPSNGWSGSAPIGQYTRIEAIGDKWHCRTQPIDRGNRTNGDGILIF